MSDERISSIQGNLNTVSLAVGRLEAVYKDLLKAHLNSGEGLREAVNSLSSRFSELKDGSFTKDLLQELKTSMQTKFAEVLDSYAVFRARFSSLESKLSQTSGDVGSHLREFELHKKEIASQQDISASAIKKLDDHHKEMASSLVQRLDEFRGVMRSEMDKAVEVVKGTPVALESAKKELMTKFENTRLDSANAVLRSNQVDMMIKVLEKKVENLSLQVKSLGG